MRKLSIVLTLVLFVQCSFAQMGINTTGAAPTTSAMLDVSSTTKGFLPPRMTTTQRGAIATPSVGLLVFDITLSQYCFWKGTAWDCIPNSTTCPPGLTNCSGLCFQLKNDVNNCGACGIVCPSGYSCVNGVCTIICPPGFSNCGGTCVAFNSSTTNCGACGTVCPSGYSCVNGVCTIVCPPGFTNCSGMCVASSSSTTNCGACGTVCPSGYSCVNGVCTIVCPPGFTKCNNSCVSLNNDNSNCGACGVACPVGQTCYNGLCR